MNKFRPLFAVLVVLFVLTSFVYPQSKETGALHGTILLEDGSAVPGVLVSLSSSNVSGASKSSLTNEEGKYRFVGLTPGTYAVSASLEGFASAKQEGIKVHIGKTFTVDLTLTQGKITEEVIVLGKSAIVDVKDSSTASVEMTKEYLQNIPNSQFTVDAVNLAPGITNDVAYGAAQGTGIAYQIDGVDVSDPDSGTAWVFLDYNVVEEVSISGVGAPAEYGGFTGVVFNTVTKSGTNSFKGYTEFLYQGDDWNSSNSDDPDLAPGKEKFYSGHLDFGGPLIKDKLNFFASFLFLRTTETLSGTTYDRDYKQPKGFLKLTWQPSHRTRIQLFGEYDSFNGTGRGGDAQTAEEATVNQKSPEFIGNISLHHLFSDYTFLEAKFAYFTGYYALEPFSGRDIPGHTDYDTGENTVNAMTFYRGDRSRVQANAAVTHHADAFMGSHDFKFGAEFSNQTLRDRGGYPGGKFYSDVAGEPYLLYEYEGYDINAKTNSFSFYAQDSWSVNNRLTINPGVRLDLARGTVKGIPGTPYQPDLTFAPRIGFTFDIFGDHSTALKGHWGRYYEGIYVSTFSRLSNEKSDANTFIYDGGEWLLDSSVAGGISQYTIDKNLKQTYMDQLTFGIERELIKDLSLGVTYIRRQNYNQIAAVDIGGIYEKVQFDETRFTNQTFTVWDQLNDRGDSKFFITNPKKGDYPTVEFTPSRKYSCIEILLNKRFSNNWQMMASYIYSKATGNINNAQSTGAGRPTMFEKPNNQIYSQGNLSADPTHMLKIQGTVVLPLAINLNVNFQLITGDAYAKTFKLPASVDSNRTVIFLEPRGSRRYPTSTSLDMRLEKTFKLDETKKLGFIVDVFNVFNQGVVTSYEYLATNFEQVLAITKPRGFRAGMRFWF